MPKDEDEDSWLESFGILYLQSLGITILILLGEAASWLYYGVWPHVSLLSLLSRMDPILADRISAPAQSWIGLHNILLMGYLTLDLASGIGLTCMWVLPIISLIDRLHDLEVKDYWAIRVLPFIFTATLGLFFYFLNKNKPDVTLP